MRAHGLTVIDETQQPAALAALSIDVLFDVAQARLTAPDAPDAITARASAADESAALLTSSTGWRHPRDTHQAQLTRRARPHPISVTSHRQARLAMQQCIAALRRWGIRNLGALAALPRAQVHERLGELGVSWQRLAAGEDEAPLVPWLAEPVFEETLDLEWPVEGFEPLSFVLARLFEPLAARLELADRGSGGDPHRIAPHHARGPLRVLPLPAPMRDPKTLRTLVLLDLESHPAEAPIDRVQVRVEPTPGRVLQWTLFERAQPATEQSGDAGGAAHRARRRQSCRHPGAGGFVEARCVCDGRVPGRQAGACRPRHRERRRPRWPCGHAPPIAPRTRPSRSGDSVCRSRSGFAWTRGGRRASPPIGMALAEAVIVQAAGPWRTSGEWWATDPAREPGLGDRSSAWDRDEWDIAMADGTVYRLFVERPVGQWFLEGVID